MGIFYNASDLPEFRNAVITIGTFDGVHKGHTTILHEVMRHAREVNGESVLLTFEPHPRKLLFPEQPLKLITPLDKKLELIRKAGIQHVVVVPFTKDFANLSADEYVQDFLVKRFQPSAIVIGYDHHFGHDRTGNINLLKKYQEKYGYKLFEISAQLIDEAAVSSTKIRKALLEGYVAEAAQMLGRNYALSGKVITGAQLGRTIGYPTANITPADAEQLVPAHGVYAVQIRYREVLHNAMLNIGNRPTVSNDLQRHIEAHIFNFDADLYNETVEIVFVERLRDEQKFATLDALKQQLGQDKHNAMQALAGR